VRHCEVLVFILFDAHTQSFEAVAIGSARRRLFLEVARHFADSPIVILFIVERLYVHHHTVAALIGPRLAHWSRTVSGLGAGFKPLQG
jgi:hypothetical protein